MRKTRVAAAEGNSPAWQQRQNRCGEPQCE